MFLLPMGYSEVIPLLKEVGRVCHLLAYGYGYGKSLAFSHPYFQETPPFMREAVGKEGMQVSFETCYGMKLAVVFFIEVCLKF